MCVMLAINLAVIALPPLVQVEIVCGGGLLGLRSPTSSALDCKTAFEAVKREALLPFDTSGGAAAVAVGSIVNITFQPVGLMSTEAVPFCRDGGLECALYSLSLCAQELGLSPGHAATEPWPKDLPTWLDLPLFYWKGLTELKGSDNLYLDFYQKYATDAGYDWGYLTSCARSPHTAELLGAAFRRSAELGAVISGQGATNASVFVDGKAVPGWATTKALRSAICAAYTGTPIEACKSATDRQPVAEHPQPLRDSSAASAEVVLLCTGGLDMLHSFCARFIDEMQSDVLPIVGASSINFTLIPAGGLQIVPNNTSSADGRSSEGLVTPYCYGGWAECELHALYHCALAAKPSSSRFIGLAGCLYWAAGVHGNFYSGSLAPVDMCEHLFGDLNWGDMVNCANGVTMDPLPRGHHGVAYTQFVSSFQQAKLLGVVLGQPAVLIGGKRSTWPHYSASGSLLKEVCVTMASPPPACRSAQIDLGRSER
jgi:hypothetical protein